MSVIRPQPSLVWQGWVRKLGEMGLYPFLESQLDTIHEQLLTNEAYLNNLIGMAVRGIDWQESVIDKDLTDPPPGALAGARYLIGSPAGGLWTGHDGEITQFDGVDWAFVGLSKGQATWVEDEKAMYVYDGLAWVIMANAVDHGTLVGLGDDDHSQYLTSGRADTWLGTKTTSNLAEGTKLYYLESRVTANASVAANTAHRGIVSGNPHGTTIGMIGAAATVHTHLDHQMMQVGASRDSAVVTNIYIESHGVMTNVSPVILPWNTTLVAMTASCSANATWTAEVHKAGALVPGASLSVAAATSAYSAAYSINFNAGDGLEFYVNGTSIPHPRIELTLVRR